MNSCKPDFREGRLLIDAESRLDALARYDILDTDPEPSFDRITRIAATLLDVPIALINFLDERRQWSKSCVGIGADTHEVDLERSFCLHTLASDDVLVIDDTTQDARFADNPLVRDTPRLRSYLGAPLVTPDGYVIGTVCVLDVQPRAWTQAQCDRLVDLAAMAMSELELRCEVARREQTEAHLQTINANVSEGIYRSTPGGRIVYANQAMAQCFGYETPDALMRVQSGTLYAVPGRREQLQGRLQEQDTVDTGDILLRRADGTMFPGRIRVTAERDAEGRVAYYDGVVRDMSERKATEETLRRTAERWERLVEAHPEPIYVSVDGVIEYINPAGAKVYGAESPEDVVGLSIFDCVMDVDDRAILNRRAQKVYTQRHATQPHEFTARRMDGEVRTIEVRSVPIEYNGKPAAQTIARDVTVQRRTEEQLQIKQHQFRQLLDNAQPIVFVLDAEGTFLISEGRDLDALGLEPGEAVGKSVYALYGDAPEVIESVERAMNGETISEVVELGDLKFDIWYAPILRSDGSTLGCIGMATDITERCRAEAALREERDLLSSIFNTSAAAITVLDTDGQIVKANTRAEDVLGLATSDIVGRSYDAPVWQHEAVDGGPFPDAEQPFVRVMETGAPVYDVEHAIRWPNGRRAILSINGAPIHDATGAMTGAVFVVDDITEQRRQRQALRESQLRYQTLVDNFPEGAVFLFDDTLRCVLAGGEELADLCPTTSDTVQGKRADDLFAPALASTIEGYFREALAGHTGVFEQEHREAYYRIRTIPLRNSEGTPHASMAVIENITEDVKMEAILRRAKQDAEEASRLKSAMLANMSHEVRTPLTSIIGFAEMLQDTPDETARHFATLIFQGGKRLLTTLDSVLHLSRLEASTQPIQRESIDLHDLAREIVNGEAIQAQTGEIALDLEPPTQSTVIRSDRGAVQRIMANLISNALKYTPAGGTVTVRADTGRAGAWFEVEDTGIGMNREFQSRMFEAFTQESEGLSRRHEGSGLGLAIVKKLTDLLGGTVEVESTPGLGTRIAVFLPYPSVAA